MKTTEDYEKQLAYLRAELKEAKADTCGEMDKVDILAKHCNELKADNERLKEENYCVSCDQKKSVHNIYLECAIKLGIENGFNSELQRRWPSEEEYREAIDKDGFQVPFDGTKKFYNTDRMKGFGAAVNWLKSYLENK
ncbi:MAG TPA: hypothetical protein VK589_06075 [Chryseolinea sp.]|nr:hypothetical protein [Chryseolinea sp.]